MSLEKREGGPSPDSPPHESNDLHAAAHRQDYASGLNIALANAASDWWSHGAQMALKQLALTGHGFDADHLLDLVGTPTDPHYVGAAFASAQRAGVIEPVGCRVASDGRLLRIWWGART